MLPAGDGVERIEMGSELSGLELSPTPSELEFVMLDASDRMSDSDRVMTFDPVSAADGGSSSMCEDGDAGSCGTIRVSVVTSLILFL